MEIGETVGARRSDDHEEKKEGSISALRFIAIRSAPPLPSEFQLLPPPSHAFNSCAAEPAFCLSDFRSFAPHEQLSTK